MNWKNTVDKFIINFNKLIYFSVVYTRDNYYDDLKILKNYRYFIITPSIQ